VKIGDVEARAQELTVQVQRLTNEREALSKKYQELRRTIAETETQRCGAPRHSFGESIICAYPYSCWHCCRQTLQGEYEAARAEVARLSEQLANSQHQSTGTLATMQGSVEGYQKQLAQTSKLLKQYSVQKQQLEGEVRFLRNQLEAAGIEIHR
jgi:hypothetical protein